MCMSARNCPDTSRRYKYEYVNVLVFAIIINWIGEREYVGFITVIISLYPNIWYKRYADPAPPSTTAVLNPSRASCSWYSPFCGPWYMYGFRDSWVSGRPRLTFIRCAWRIKCLVISSSLTPEMSPSLANWRRIALRSSGRSCLFIRCCSNLRCFAKCSS